MSTQPSASRLTGPLQFGWYQPRYVESQGPPQSTFPPLSKVVMSDALDGNVSDEEMMKRRAELGFAWECHRSIEEIWSGPPMSDKVPPALDYERLLMKPLDSEKESGR
ncbi:hypothetical protein ERJ75_000331100 [Trypanosoma vivax]|uniref:Uncharacterized protein n=1 Tax=Trypanosoma vivax (strain Y486) TaxID=1055687 RepID=G0UAI5_TRYVY|nr:hypothetical protein TRVL_03778 [Trypanosoma vivax]KAH8618004.1 hypothetical protein ERJ75_000331100 [Trypanosoma vivax]CCC52818.1 conserved hypothetical protein [Trypanosoma vivax Y486]